MVGLTDELLEAIVVALDMRANYIETGSVTLSHDDAVERKNLRCLRLLDPSQKKLVKLMRNGRATILQAREDALNAAPRKRLRLYEDGE